MWKQRKQKPERRRNEDEKTMDDTILVSVPGLYYASCNGPCRGRTG